MQKNVTEVRVEQEKLQNLIEAAKTRVESMTPTQIEEMLAQQAISWARGEAALAADERATTLRLQRSESSDPSGDRLRSKIVSCGSPNDPDGEHIATIKTYVVDLKQHTEDDGWFVYFAGARGGLFVGKTEPDLRINDDCELRIFRMTKRTSE